MAGEEAETPKVSEDTDVHALASCKSDFVALPEFIRGLSAAKGRRFPSSFHGLKVICTPRQALSHPAGCR